MKKVVVEITSRSILFTIITLIGFWFLYQIRDILFGLFVSILIMGAMNPAVARLEKKRIPRTMAILIIYLALVLILAVVLAVVIPSLVQQVRGLINVIPQLSEQSSFLFFSKDAISNQIKQLGSLPTQFLKLIVSVFSNIINFLAILVVTFYLLLEHKNLDKYLFSIFGKNGQEKGRRIIVQLEERLGGWVRAEILLMTFIGVLSYAGFLLLGLEFALTLAIIAGILEIVPNIGPIVASVPAIIAGFLISPFIGIATVCWCFLVQQIENNFLVPKVMKSAVGVNPIITLLSLTVGFKMAGVAGALLAIPIYLAFEVILAGFFTPRSKGQTIESIIDKSVLK